MQQGASLLGCLLSIAAVLNADVALSADTRPAVEDAAGTLAAPAAQPDPAAIDAARSTVAALLAQARQALPGLEALIVEQEAEIERLRASYAAAVDPATRRGYAEILLGTSQALKTLRGRSADLIRTIERLDAQLQVLPAPEAD